jgi:hypothetical protein
MTEDDLNRIRDWDARCGENDTVFLPVVKDRRALLTYVDELRAEIRTLREAAKAGEP